MLWYHLGFRFKPIVVWTYLQYYSCHRLQVEEWSFHYVHEDQLLAHAFKCEHVLCFDCLHTQHNDFVKIDQSRIWNISNPKCRGCVSVIEAQL